MKLPCAHGWHEHCADCAREADALDAEFDRKVAAGEYDSHGYTPLERRAYRKRCIKRGRALAQRLNA